MEPEPPIEDESSDLLTLPDDLLGEVFALSVLDIGAAPLARVCRRFYDVVKRHAMVHAQSTPRAVGSILLAAQPSEPLLSPLHYQPWRLSGQITRASSWPQIWTGSCAVSGITRRRAFQIRQEEEIRYSLAAKLRKMVSYLPSTMVRMYLKLASNSCVSRLLALSRSH